MSNKHFALNERAATVLAHVVCHDNGLPQGAPTSPVVSNLIAHILDVRLAKMSRRFGVHYTRYADDLTFSTNRRAFPEQIARCDDTGKWVAGEVLNDMIARAGFEINPEKTRMQFRQSRQDVTGLIVNEKVNVRNEYYRDARAKCHSLFTTGKFTIKTRVVNDDGAVEIKDVDGKIDQLSGQLSFIDSVKRFQKDFDKEYELTGYEKNYRNFLLYKNFFAPYSPMILCEGKTDNIYIRCAIMALSEKYPGLVECKDGKSSLKISLFNYNDHTKRLMGVAGGAGQFNSFIVNYRKNLKSFKAKVARQPVILLIDNDSGAKSIFECIKNVTKKPCNGKDDFYLVVDNLYVVPTPRGDNDSQTMIEDFLPSKWRNEKLGGKVLNLSGNLDTDREYGKALFAEHVIKRNRKNVDFSGMTPVLDRIQKVLDDFSTK